MTEIAIIKLITGIRFNLRSAKSAYVDLHAAKDAYSTNPGIIEKNDKKAVHAQKISSNVIRIEFNNINTVNMGSDTLIDFKTVTRARAYIQKSSQALITKNCSLLTVNGVVTIN